MSLFTSLVPSVAHFWFEQPISDTSIILLDSRRKQIGRQTWSFVCKKKTATIFEIWEPSSAIWPRLGEIRVILCLVCPLWRMVEGAQLWVLRQRTSRICNCMHSCISVSALCIRCEGSCSCFSKLTCWFGRAMQELLIQEPHVAMGNANSTQHARRTKMDIFSDIIFSLWHVLNVTGVSGHSLMLLFILIDTYFQICCRILLGLLQHIEGLHLCSLWWNRLQLDEFCYSFSLKTPIGYIWPYCRLRWEDGWHVLDTGWLL